MSDEDKLLIKNIEFDNISDKTYAYYIGKLGYQFLIQYINKATISEQWKKRVLNAFFELDFNAWFENHNISPRIKNVDELLKSMGEDPNEYNKDNITYVKNPLIFFHRLNKEKLIKGLDKNLFLWKFSDLITIDVYYHLKIWESLPEYISNNFLSDKEEINEKLADMIKNIILEEFRYIPEDYITDEILSSHMSYADIMDTKRNEDLVYIDLDESKVYNEMMHINFDEDKDNCFVALVKFNDGYKERLLDDLRDYLLKVKESIDENIIDVWDKYFSKDIEIYKKPYEDISRIFLDNFIYCINEENSTYEKEGVLYLENNNILNAGYYCAPVFVNLNKKETKEDIYSDLLDDLFN